MYMQIHYRTNEFRHLFNEPLLMKFNFPNILILKNFILIGNLTSHVLINFYIEERN